jgi:hypothetical protein
MDERLISELIKELQESKERDRDVLNTMQMNIEKLTKLLMGNGEVGLCEQVRSIKSSIKPLWIIVSIIGTAILTGLAKYIFWG